MSKAIEQLTPAMTLQTTAITDFFQNIPAMRHIREITDAEQYRDIPEDWWIALTDVVDSTGAIQAGKYKSVNTCAAAAITAVLNSIPDVEVPFLFGGDGMAVLVPPQVRQRVADALVAVQQIARNSFELDLRIGLVPVADVMQAGYRVRVGKVQSTETFQQPVFMGGGLDYAESLLKAPEQYPQYQITPRGDEEADLSGFECRWSKHKARSEEVVSLLIRAVGNESEANNHIYNAILDEIERIYGERSERHPIRFDAMQVALRPEEYRYEVGVKNPQQGWRGALRLMFFAIAGFLRWRFLDKIWDRYRGVVYDTTDHEKFDDTLRMTISGTTAQRQELRDYLDVWRNTGEVVYGMHISDHTLMTCIVFDRFGRQVHFLDADDGGYAMAARELKAQIRDRGYNAATAFTET